MCVYIYRYVMLYLYILYIFILLILYFDSCENASINISVGVQILLLISFSLQIHPRVLNKVNPVSIFLEGTHCVGGGEEILTLCSHKMSLCPWLYGTQKALNKKAPQNPNICGGIAKPSSLGVKCSDMVKASLEFVEC